MPDTSKMSPEEYKSFTEGQATKSSRDAGRKLTLGELRQLYDAIKEDELKAADQQEQFKPGQTVWDTRTGRDATVHMVDGESVWVTSGMAPNVAYRYSLKYFTAINPNAEPQKCPTCGRPK